MVPLVLFTGRATTPGSPFPSSPLDGYREWIRSLLHVGFILLVVSPDIQNQCHILIIMCYWRRVRNYYKGCGHTVNLPDEEIKCDLRNCKFSPKHSPTCSPPQCSTMCWQYRQYPQQYAPQIDKKCPRCS